MMSGGGLEPTSAHTPALRTRYFRKGQLHFLLQTYCSSKVPRRHVTVVKPISQLRRLRAAPLRKAADPATSVTLLSPSQSENSFRVSLRNRELHPSPSQPGNLSPDEHAADWATAHCRRRRAARCTKLQGCCRAVAGLLQGCCRVAEVLLQGCCRAVAGLLQGCCRAVAGLLQGC